MYTNTLFGEIMRGLPRSTFNHIVNQEQADKYCKGFNSWDQFTAMAYGQLSHCQSLREIEAGFNSQSHHHYHLGTRAVKRSTLADANAKPRAGLYAKVCDYLMKVAHRKVRQQLSSYLYLIDSSPIHLRGRNFDDWAKQYRNNVSQGLKLHLVLEAQQVAPVYGKVTMSKTSDLSIGQAIPLESGATYVFDKGYYQFNWWHQIDQLGSVFITRLKKNAAIEAVQSLEIPAVDQSSVLEDCLARFTRKTNGKDNERNLYYAKHVRRIVIHRPDKCTPLILVTNDFSRTASEIAALYKKRWDIELFFKWIKQNLKLKRFVGYSEHAVRTQLYIAIIVYLLIYLYKQHHQTTLTPTLYLATIRQVLFERPKTEYWVRKRRRQFMAVFNQKQYHLPLCNYLGQ